jgi:hypothetical protein
MLYYFIPVPKTTGVSPDDNSSLRTGVYVNKTANVINVVNTSRTARKRAHPQSKLAACKQAYITIMYDIR